MSLRRMLFWLLLSTGVFLVLLVAGVTWPGNVIHVSSADRISARLCQTPTGRTSKDRSGRSGSITEGDSRWALQFPDLINKVGNGLQSTASSDSHSGATKQDPVQSLAKTNTSKAVFQFVTSLIESGEEAYLPHNTSYFIPRSKIINAFYPKLIIQTRDLCPKDDLFLLVVIPSLANKFLDRQAVRDTWASQFYGVSSWPRAKLRHSIKIVFFLGVTHASNSIKQESALYGDIVQADFIDTYRNLTLKTAAMFHWATNYCPSARHVLKVDTDTFVNLPLLAELLEVVSARRDTYIIGYRVGTEKNGTKVLRKKPSKWAVSVDEYPFPAYPMYTIGGSYVVTGNAIPLLLNAYQHMPSIPVEDALFAGILRKVAGVKQIHCPHFTRPMDEWVRDRCKLVQTRAVTQTGLKPPSQLYAMWKRVVSGDCHVSITLKHRWLVL
ncbi:hypothetical protein BaRGS_00002251 [Batillaria attramentaria]|uniref:Hexosyltransferase n=1 Tax=Batillaria attramentaria TaxID=370345 RepID=A0ABD0M5Z3_9CAEN